MSFLLRSVALLACVLSASGVARPQSNDRPAFMSYWEISKSLAVDEWGRMELEISPSELKKILAMRDSEYSKARKTQPIDWRTLDLSILNNLREMLSRQQFEKLDSTVLSNRYRSGFRPFMDRELMEFVNLTSSDIAMLSSHIEETQKRYYSEVESLQKNAASKTIGKMPGSAKVLFAEFAGNEFCPDVSIKEIVAVELMPYPVYMKNITCLVDVADKIPGLSQIQFADLKAISSEVEELGRNYTRESQGPIKEFSDRLSQETWIRTKSVLTPAQLTYALRKQVMIEFLGDCSGPFRDSRFVEYLQLDKEASSALSTFAKEQASFVSTQRRKLNREVFDELSSKLPKKSADRLKLLFVDVWR